MKRVVLILTLALTSSSLSPAASADAIIASSADVNTAGVSVNDVEFLWPPTEICPGPNDEDVWQCYNVKNNGDDIAVYSQSQDPDNPTLGIHATKIDLEARLLCEGEPLTVIATSSGEETTWFTFKQDRYSGVEVSNVGIAIPNSSEVLDGSYVGQLLDCDQWPYENSRVSRHGGDGKGLKVTMETRSGSSFNLELLIPYHWADGDLDHNRVVEDPPDEEPPGTGGGDARFLDVGLDHVFNTEVEWLAEEGITRGCDPPNNLYFCPEDPVTRGQMAAFLVRALGYVDDGGGDLFIDDDGSVFEADIDRLGTAGVTRGCNPPFNDRYCPGEPVTRGQMAAFLARALSLPNLSVDQFTDDDGLVFEQDIQALAASGITRGCNPPVNDRFCPGEPVTRGQMAAFLYRAFNG